VAAANFSLLKGVEWRCTADDALLRMAGISRQPQLKEICLTLACILTIFIAFAA
jgi:hypothetical protein